MIIVQLWGGLGNQLFQYAAGVALARRCGVVLRMDTWYYTVYEDRVYELQHFHIPQDFATNGEVRHLRPRNRIVRKLCRYLKLTSIDRTYYEPFSYYDENFERLGPDTYLQGYFQSERYFKANSEEIRRLFTPTTTPEGKTIDLIRKAEMPVSLHIRRGDQISNPAALAKFGETDLTYYRQAIDRLMHELAPVAPTFFIFSDDLPWVRQHMDFIPSKFFVEGNVNKPHDDMWLMSQCRHHIIAKSSFSWWGAWLNANNDKKVIAPRQSIQLNTQDLCPPEWILL